MKADPLQARVTDQWAHTSPLIACRFDPTGTYVFASAEDSTVQRWRLADGKKVSFPAVHDSWVGALAFHSDGKTLFTGGYDGQVKWWPAAGDHPQPLRSIDAHKGWVRALSITPDGRFLVSGGNDRLVRIWDAADGRLVRELPGHSCHVYSLLVHPSGQWILSGDLKGEIRQWELATGRLVRTFDAKALHSYNTGQQVDYGGVRSMALTADGTHLVAGGLYNASNPLGAVNEPLVLRFQWSDQKKTRSHVMAGTQGLIWRVIAHPDGFVIGGCSGTAGGLLGFWKGDADKEFFKFPMPNYLRDLDVHPDGVRLATAHYDRTLRITRMAKPA